jgi:hypothetical protein
MNRSASPFFFVIYVAIFSFITADDRRSGFCINIVLAISYEQLGKPETELST